MAAQTDPIMVAPTDTELLQAQGDLWRHSLCYLTSMALKCAVELGIPTAIHRLGGAATLPSLATELSIPQSKLPFLGRIMRFLASSGVFTADDSSGEGITYGHNLLSKLLVDGIVLDGDAHQKAIVLTTTSRYYMEAAHGLASWLKKDDTSAPVRSPFQDLHGATLFDDSMACLDPEAHELFTEALAAHDNLGISVVLQKCPDLFRGIKSLTDCCGGDGTTAKAIVKAFPHIKCTVLDLHPVINKISADDTIEYVAGDMFKFIPPAQAVLLKLVLHFWNNENCVKILTQCKKAIPPREEGGKVIIIDIVVGSTSKEMLEIELLMDMLMLAVTNGQQRDENEWREIFMKAGFSCYKIVKKLGPQGIFEVYP